MMNICPESILILCHRKIPMGRSELNMFCLWLRYDLFIVEMIYASPLAKSTGLV